MKRMFIIVIVLSIMFGIPAYIIGYGIGYRWGLELKSVSFEDNKRLYIDTH